jgi:hypothetical protein
MKFTTFGVTLACCSSFFVACNRDRQHDSMAPEGASAEPRPLGIEETTPNRDGGAPANTASAPKNLGEPTGVTGNGTGGAGGIAAATSAGAGGRRP